MTDAIQFKPTKPKDRAFLYRVYASTRVDELSVVPWSEDEKQAFLRQQFDAQNTHYQASYPDASFDLIVQAGQPIGRLYVDRRPSEIRIVDIALLLEHRRFGIGGRIMQDILAEAQAQGLPVSIHVEQNNPAMRLYHRLGFAKIDETGIYHLMRWNPNPAVDREIRLPCHNDHS